MQTNLDFFNNLFHQDIVSEYSHSNYIDEIDNKRFFHMDCSGFVYWCLAQMGYKRALVELRSFLKQNHFIKINRFFCKDFIFISQHQQEFKYWQFIDKPVAGSIMVVVFPDDNGHCVFVKKIIATNKNTIKIQVIDSTQHAHKNDNRKKDKTGIGMGEIEIMNKNGDWFYDSGNQDLPIRRADIYFVLPKNK